MSTLLTLPLWQGCFTSLCQRSSTFSIFWSRGRGLLKTPPKQEPWTFSSYTAWGVRGFNISSLQGTRCWKWCISIHADACGHSFQWFIVCIGRVAKWHYVAVIVQGWTLDVRKNTCMLTLDLVRLQFSLSKYCNRPGHYSCKLSCLMIKDSILDTLNLCLLSPQILL